MTIRSEQVEQEVLERVRPNYEREGYKFIVGPSPSDLPSFLEGVLPDALASRNGENVVIEVKSTLRSADRSALVKFLASEVRKHPGWRFDLVIAEKQLGVADSQYEPSESELVDELSKIEALTEGGALKPHAPVQDVVRQVDAAKRKQPRDPIAAFDELQHRTQQALDYAGIPLLIERDRGFVRLARIGCSS